MRVIDNIKAIYNKKPYTQKYTGLVSIKEPSNADTKQIDVLKAGIDFYLLAQEFYKNQPNVSTGKGSEIKDLDCDGIVFYKEDKKQHILAVELKSGFNGDKIREGYSQIFFTLLKLYAFLSLCDDFDFSKYKITSYLVCQPIKDLNEETAIWDNLLQKNTAGETLNIADQVIYNHILKNGQDVNVKIKDIGLVKGLLGQHLASDICDQTITFRLYTMQNLGDNNGTLLLP